MGLTGITMTQTFSFLGLSYSTPILVCAMGHLIPTFNFLLSLILSRKAELKLKSSGVLIQVMGSVVSIMGAALTELFRGPLIRHSSDHQLQHTNHHFFVFSSTPEFWVLGGLLLASASFSVTLWNSIQKETVNLYPEPMKVMSYYSLLGTILSIMVALMVERDLDAWKLKHNTELILIVLTGPFYVQLFKPFGIAYATTFGISFFPNTLHYGSVIGTAIIGMGYYCVMWGQMKGDEDKRGCECDEVKSSDSLVDEKVPLLQQKMEV
ncbi:WAT1-related protein [Senna tora]|uniref:WAT1-related protein n=1 Tax=Senna tora TaxID=362788 RepID=A0A834SWN9_9FABA|nr:WAT1-related protein [Senna tora]